METTTPTTPTEEIMAYARERMPSVEECVVTIFRTGRFCPRGTTLEEFLDRFDYTPWWPKDLDATTILASEEFRRGFAAWMQRRRDWCLTMLEQELIAAGGLRVVRSIGVSADWSPGADGRGLGLFWSLNCEVAVSSYYWDENAYEVVISAHVDASSVDWPATLFARMDYLNGDDEAEIQLHEGAPVYVDKFDGAPLHADGGEFKA